MEEEDNVDDDDDDDDNDAKQSLLKMFETNEPRVQHTSFVKVFETALPTSVDAVRDDEELITSVLIPLTYVVFIIFVF